MKKHHESLILVSLVLLAFVLRLWGVAAHGFYEGDEGTLVPASITYLNSGNFSPDKFEHPPLKYFLLVASMRLFGNNAYGWRVKNIFFGSFTIVVLMLMCKELLPDKKIAVLAALFLLFDPVHLFYSRTVYGEVPATFFFVLAAYMTILFLKGKLLSPLPAGICAGLALASKWYFVVPLLSLFLYTVVYQIKKKGFHWLTLFHLSSIYLILPVSIYILPFFPWFKRGYSFTELLQNQIDAYVTLQNQPLETFTNSFFRLTPSSPWEWFVKPLIVGVEVAHKGAWGQFLMFMNDPLFWIFVIPAMLYASYRTWMDQHGNLALIILLFISLYMQFLFVDRPLFLYSAVVLLPFAYLLVAWLLVTILTRLFRDKQWPYAALVTFICLWGLYLYPLATNKYIPVGLYRPLFSLGTVFLQ